MEPTSPSPVSSRKLEDAIRTLDEAIVPSLTAIERPTPSKRPHLTRSVYSTLAKFGVKSWERARSSNTHAVDVSKSAPHLSAIITRSASQFRKAPPSNNISTHLVHPVSEYRPSSTDSLLSRLATYKITTYANKPSQIDAVAAAMCGWINDGKDRLVCGICDVSWVLAGREGMTKDAAGALVEKQRASLVEVHKDGCPWKARQCDPSIYRVPVQAPTAMIHQLRSTAQSLEPMLANVAVKHPLAPSQLSFLRSVFSTAPFPGLTSGHDSATDHREGPHSVVPSDTAILVALFGWISAPIAACDELRHMSSSISRAGSYGRSASIPTTPALSRTNSVSSHFREPASTPAPSAPPQMSISQFNTSPHRIMASSRLKHPRSSNSITISPTSRDTPLVYCLLCQRRVGLWRYSRNKAATTLAQNDHSTSVSREEPKEFDLVKEHRSYCPYIVCSSMVPSFSHSSMADLPGNAMEGWRAVLTIVQRYELGQRQHLSRFLPSNDPDCQASLAELKGVKAMVAGVKTDGVSSQTLVSVL
ncbi:zf-C3HC-domain-containing protein [Chiua virens]|nr:zf-C3HC-domain-containing protein [Chiua virens]